MAELKLIDCPHCGVRNRVQVMSEAGKQIRCGRCKADLFAAVVEECSEADFSVKVLGSSVPVLVDFWADWCGPCKMLAPELVKLAGLFVGKLRVVKVNIDENSALANGYAIRSVPTMLLVKNGKVVDTLNGAMPANALAQRLQPWLT